ncbi:MAG: hypothetical protein LR015_02580 [Verrucomicrobia bacterium]|nr:hypothetical protein [Verrucomicrobiota bacterium]
MVAAEIMRWWQRNSESNHTSIIYAYPLGKTQRLLHMLTEGPGPVGLLGNGNSFLPAYRNAGVPMVPVVELTGSTVQDLRGKGLVIVSASIQNDGLLRQLGKIETAFASGWMAVRSARRQSGYSTGFVLSDHSDWGGLLRAIECSGAERIGLVHGETEPLAHYLRAKGSYQFVGQPGDPGW